MSDCLDPDCLKSVRQILAAARFAAERHATQRRTVRGRLCGGNNA